MLTFDVLERRDCPATVSLVGSTLTIIGTPGKDAIGVKVDNGQVIVLDGAVETAFAANKVTEITIQGRGGRDLLINATTLPAEILGNGGRDVIISYGPGVLRGGKKSDMIQSAFGKPLPGAGESSGPGVGGLLAPVMDDVGLVLGYQGDGGISLTGLGVGLDGQSVHLGGQSVGLEELGIQVDDLVVNLDGLNFGAEVLLSTLGETLADLGLDRDDFGGFGLGGLLDGLLGGGDSNAPSGGTNQDGAVAIFGGQGRDTIRISGEMATVVDGGRGRDQVIID